MECDFDLGKGLRNGVFSLTQFLLLGLRLYGFNLLSPLHSAENGGGSSHMDLPLWRVYFRPSES